jgi:hypothetical protein
MAALSPYERAWLDRALISIAAAKTGPSAADLAAAPELDLWVPQVSFIGELVLDGEVRAHPILGDEAITTSPIIALNPDGSWARTVSRWYRLGRCGLETKQEETTHFHRLKLLPPEREQIDRRLEVYIEHMLHLDEMDQQEQAGG